ncbi:MAG: polyprenyl synthetase family protein [Syntrophorhabdales bacterium]
MDLATFLAEKRVLVENRLRAILSAFPASSGILGDAMEYSLFSDGKRIRPGLAIAACEAMDGDTEVVLPFAAAIEMIHTYSLIHDDLPCMDNDDLRRGKPTCHKVFGDAVALLAGDALLTEAFRVMTDPRESSASPEITQKVVYEIARAAGAAGMVAGQAVDVIYEGKKGTKSIVNLIHRNKTGALIRASVLAGALVGNANEKELKCFTRFGESIGLAFQIMDDLLDVEGTEAEVGKKLKKDTEKQTYVRYYGIAASKARIDALVNKAIAALRFLGPGADMLVQVANFIGHRSF